ncbi:MAG: hypothetical protein AAF570_09780, partial [Bacteroidota bacterium]
EKSTHTSVKKMMCDCSQADHDGNGIVSTLDLAALLQAFGTFVSENPANAWADFDEDGFIGTPDLLCMLQQFGQEC